MAEQLTISVSKIFPFIKDIKIYNVSKEDIIRVSGVPEELFNSPDNRLTGEQTNRMIKTAVELTKNENLGLQQGERLSRGFSNILGYVLMNCPTALEAWGKYSKYERILDETGYSDFKLEEGLAVLSNNTIDISLKHCRQFSDYKLSGMLSYAKLLTGVRFPLKKVYFTHAAPEDASEYTRIFRCPVYFRQQTNALVFEKELLDTTVVDPSIELMEMLEGQVKEAHQRLEEGKLYTGRTAEILLSNMKGELPTIEFIASKLAVSVRSLQLYLRREGTSYTELVNKVRREIAEKYLKDKSVSIDEIAFLLGFSETSTFSRAFKKWTRITPGSYRHSLDKGL